MSPCNRNRIHTYIYICVCYDPKWAMFALLGTRDFRENKTTVAVHIARILQLRRAAGLAYSVEQLSSRARVPRWTTVRRQGIKLYTHCSRFRVQPRNTSSLCVFCACASRPWAVCWPSGVLCSRPNRRKRQSTYCAGCWPVTGNGKRLSAGWWRWTPWISMACWPNWAWGIRRTPGSRRKRSSSTWSYTRGRRVGS